MRKRGASSAKHLAKGEMLLAGQEEFGSMFNRIIFSTILKIPLGLLSRVQKLIVITYLMTMELATNSSQ